MARRFDYRRVDYKGIALNPIFQEAACLFLAIIVSLAVLFLFAALTYSNITLPRYTTSHPQKDAQQVVNLIVAIIAAVIGILLAHCVR